VRLIVADSGSGMDETILARIFEPLVHDTRHARTVTSDFFGSVAHLSGADEAAEIYHVVQRLHGDSRPDFPMLIDRGLHVRLDLRVTRTAFESAFSFHCASRKKS
jgi:hypothetical protein